MVRFAIVALTVETAQPPVDDITQPADRTAPAARLVAPLVAVDSNLLRSGRAKQRVHVSEPGRVIVSLRVAPRRAGGKVGALLARGESRPRRAGATAVRLVTSRTGRLRLRSHSRPRTLRAVMSVVALDRSGNRRELRRIARIVVPSRAS